MGPYVVHWLTGIDDVTLFAMVTKTKPLYCTPTRAWWAGQREQHPAEKIFIQIIVRRQTQIRFLVGCSFFLLPKRNRCGRHSKALQNLNLERNWEFKEPVCSAHNHSITSSLQYSCCHLRLIKMHLIYEVMYLFIAHYARAASGCPSSFFFAWLCLEL